MGEPKKYGKIWKILVAGQPENENVIKTVNNYWQREPLLEGQGKLLLLNPTPRAPSSTSHVCRNCGRLAEAAARPTVENSEVRA